MTFFILQTEAMWDDWIRYLKNYRTVSLKPKLFRLHRRKSLFVWCRIEKDINRSMQRWSCRKSENDSGEWLRSKLKKSRKFTVQQTAKCAQSSICAVIAYRNP